MQPSADTTTDSEDKVKDYTYDETDYEDSDSDLEEGEIRENESEPPQQDNNPASIQQSIDYLNTQLENCRNQTTWKQYFPYPDCPPQGSTHPWLDMSCEELIRSANRPIGTIPEEEENQPTQYGDWDEWSTYEEDQEWWNQ